MSELTRRYVVMSLATAAPFDPADRDAVFVLKPWKDPAALRALAAYRDNCYPELARDLDAWMRVITAGPVVRGDVGRRNDAHVKTGHASARGGRTSRAGRTGHARPEAGARGPTPRSGRGSRHTPRQKRRRRRRSS
jgi:hypothetical protein